MVTHTASASYLHRLFTPWRRFAPNSEVAVDVLLYLQSLRLVTQIFSSLPSCVVNGILSIPSLPNAGPSLFPVCFPLVHALSDAHSVLPSSAFVGPWCLPFVFVLFPVFCAVLLLSWSLPQCSVHRVTFKSCPLSLRCSGGRELRMCCGSHHWLDPVQVPPSAWACLPQPTGRDRLDGYPFSSCGTPSCMVGLLTLRRFDRRAACSLALFECWSGLPMSCIPDACVKQKVGPVEQNKIVFHSSLSRRSVFFQVSFCPFSLFRLPLSPSPCEQLSRWPLLSVVRLRFPPCWRGSPPLQHVWGSLPPCCLSFCSLLFFPGRWRWSFPLSRLVGRLSFLGGTRCLALCGTSRTLEPACCVRSFFHPVKPFQPPCLPPRFCVTRFRCYFPAHRHCILLALAFSVGQHLSECRFFLLRVFSQRPQPQEVITSTPPDTNVVVFPVCSCQSADDSMTHFTHWELVDMKQDSQRLVSGVLLLASPGCAECQDNHLYVPPVCHLSPHLSWLCQCGLSFEVDPVSFCSSGSMSRHFQRCPLCWSGSSPLQFLQETSSSSGQLSPFCLPCLWCIVSHVGWVLLPSLIWMHRIPIPSYFFNASRSEVHPSTSCIRVGLSPSFASIDAFWAGTSCLALLIVLFPASFLMVIRPPPTLLGLFSCCVSFCWPEFP